MRKILYYEEKMKLQNSPNSPLPSPPNSQTKIKKSISEID